MHLQAKVAKVHYLSKSDGAKDRAIHGKAKRSRMLLSLLLLHTFSSKQPRRMCTFNQNANKYKPWKFKM
jgi:hypothetical protein